jgi:Glutaminase
MAKHIVVGGIDRLETPVHGPIETVDFSLDSLTVYFANDYIANLAPGDPDFAYRKKLLTDFHRVGLPVYAEVEPSRRTITALLIPVSGRVVGLYRSPGGDITFQLDHSPKSYGFAADHPKYAHFLHILNEAQLDGFPVTVTETEDEGESEPEIIDIRQSENPPEPALLEAVDVAPAIHHVAMRPVPPDVAVAMFNLVASHDCDPSFPTDSCIPFRYPDEGCEARAHEMCRLIIQQGVQPTKVFNVSPDPRVPMMVKTNNSRKCVVKWFFHVAVALPIQSSGNQEVQMIVLDPSLFPTQGPVPVEVWQSRQSVPFSPPAFTSPDVYLPPGYPDPRDPDFRKTIKELTRCRGKLQRRAGKIPFNCPGNGPS